MFNSRELQSFGLQETYPPCDLWRNRFDENGAPITELATRHSNVSSALLKYLGEMQFSILLGGSSTNSSFIADEAQPQDFDWVVIIDKDQGEVLNLDEESDMLTATEEINPWMDVETRDKLRFHSRRTVAPEIAANKTQFNDVIVRVNPEPKKYYYSFENNQWYYALAQEC